MIELNKDFREALYESLIMVRDELGTEKMKRLKELNGIAPEQLDYTEFINKFLITNTTADASIDGNANVRSKDVVTMLNEMSKPHSKLLAFNKIFVEMSEKYGQECAVSWLKDELFGNTYLHDAYSSTFVPYCYAYTLKDVAERGLYFIEGFGAKPPKHLDTFIDFVAEFISYNCNRTSGAVGLPDFLVYAYYFWTLDKDYVVDSERYLKQQFQRFIYRCNQPFLRSGTQSAFVNTSVFDREYFAGLFGGQEFPDGSLMILEAEPFIEFQKKFLEVMSEIRSENMFTFPVNTISLVKKDEVFCDEDFAEWANRHNMKWADSNFYISDTVDTLSNCCRLQSNVKDLFFNSIGGTALSVGSVKVNTINLANMAFVGNEECYFTILKERTRTCLKVLDVIRGIIARNVEKGLLPNYKHGLINMANQYNTIGINGLYEAVDSFGYINTDEIGNHWYSKKGFEFAKRVFREIKEVIEEFDFDYMVNIEQIPGENCARILLEKDKLLHEEYIKTELPLYGNQFIPLGVKAMLVDRVKTSAILDKECNGGSILHINLDAPLKDEDDAWAMLDYISDAGVNYFAFNTRISACENNHGFYGDTCPVCGGTKTTEYTRIVGFLTPISSWSSTRKEEYDKRMWH